MKKASIFLSILLAMMLLASCGEQATTSVAESTAESKAESSVQSQDISTQTSTSEANQAQEIKGKKEIKVGYLVEMMDNNQTNIYNHIKRSFTNMNEKQDKYEFTTFTAFDANNSAEKMSSDLETCVVDGYDLLIVQPVDPAGVAAAYEYCWDNNTPIIDIRAVSVTKKVAALYAGLNDELMAIAMHDWVDTYLDEHPDVNLVMGLVYPDPGSTGSFIRLDMMKELAQERPDRLTIIGEGYGNWATEEAQKLTEDWIQGHPDMNIVICANDESALGAINALEAAGIKDKVIVMGVNAASLGTSMVEDGRLDIDIGVKFDVVMDRLAEVAVDLLDGKEVCDPETRQVDVSDLKMTAYVTPDNVDEWSEYVAQFGW